MTLLKVRNMSISFKMYEDGLKQYSMGAVSDISLDIDRGEILAVVGSSGSGKSLFAHGIMGILPKNARLDGTIVFDGEPLDRKRQEDLRGRKIALVPQSVSYLDPLMKVGRQVQGRKKNKESIKKLRKAFARYDLCEDSEQLYPYQLSGGMARRVLTSTVEQGDIDLIIADEPTPGLDSKLALRTLNYFRGFANRNKAVILITHDIDLALNVADRILIFYGGTILESAPIKDFNKGVDFLRHPYTQALFNALPQNEFKPIEGSQPYGMSLDKACLFAPRCHMADDQCYTKIEMRELRGGMVRCVHAT